MTDDNSSVNTESDLVDIPEDLKAFKDFFDGKTPEPVKEEVEDTEDDALATDEDTDASDEDEDLEDEDSQDDEDSEESDDESEDEEDKSEEKPKGKKPSAQQRINELTRLRHEAERREAALAERLSNLEKELRVQKPEGSKQEPIAETLPAGAPKPDEVNDKGELKYPLGEFDPMFIRDMTKFTITAELEAAEKTRQAQAEAARVQAEAEQIRKTWAERVTEAEKDIPEIREHIADLADTFANVEPQYGEYLATLIMTSESGPAIMEYLSQNIGEAQNIVAAGPTAATRMIGRLEAKLERVARPTEEEKRNKRTSKAPEPPKTTVRGSKGRTSVRPDTDDLAAFKRDYFSK